MTDLRVVTWPIERLIDYARNPRKNDEQVDRMVAVIREFGFRIPIVARSDGTVIDGHLRLKAARKMGIDTVPVALADELTDNQVKAFRLLANQSANWASWDDGLLRLELDDLSIAGFDISLTGFGLGELDAIMATPRQPGAAGDADDVPDVPKQVVTVPGDVWRLGDHRLICGDATSQDTLDALTLGQEAELCFTSPPYAQQRHYGYGATNWLTMMRGAFLFPPLADHGQLLVNLGMVHHDNEWLPYWDPWLDAMCAEGWRRFGLYVWDQGPGLPGEWKGRPQPAFEFIFHLNRESARVRKTKRSIHAGELSAGLLRTADNRFTGHRSKGATPIQATKMLDTVIRVTRHKGALGKGIDHPAVFPIGLPLEVIPAFSDPGDMIYEPFSGAGTTILACEMLRRVAYAIEISPNYVDVSVIRYQRLTGRPAVHEETGLTFEELADQRVGSNPLGRSDSVAAAGED